MKGKTHILWTVVILVAVRAQAQASIIVDHPPLNTGGPSSDTDFLTTSGQPYWQLLADDFTLSDPASIANIKWWGFYGNNFSNDSTQPPPGVETMRVRFYNARQSDELPGDILYDQLILNPSRTATGRLVFTTRVHPEFVYETDLPTPFQAQGGDRYWMEVVQVGTPSSVFRWEFSSAPNDTEAFINPDVIGWTYRPGVNLAFQLSDVPEPAACLLLTFLLIAYRKSFRRR